MKKTLNNYIKKIDKIDRTLLDLIIGILFLNLIIVLTAFIIIVKFNTKSEFILGVLLGGATSVILAIHLYMSIDKTLDMKPDAIKRYAFQMYITRMGISAVSLVIAIIVKDINFIGCVVGLFSLKVAAYFQPITNKYISKKIFNKGR